MAGQQLAFAATARRFEAGTQALAMVAGMQATLDLMLTVGPDAIERCVLTLAGQIVEGLRARGYQVAGSARQGAQRLASVHVVPPEHSSWPRACTMAGGVGKAPLDCKLSLQYANTVPSSKPTPARSWTVLVVEAEQPPREQVESVGMINEALSEIAADLDSNRVLLREFAPS
jgi:hypothetical protein